MKKVYFVPKDNDAVDFVTPPKSAAAYIPNWYKNIPPFHDDKNSFSKHTPAQPTAKKCIPFLEGFTTGYIQETWCDIHIEPELESGKILPLKYSWAGRVKPISTRMENNAVHDLLPKKEEYYPIELQWHTQWEPKLPKGWSALYTHPLSRYDLPFFTLSGVIETDKYPIPGPIPFYIKKGFSGTIPVGTPMYQVIPIKREDWESISLNVGDIDTDIIIQNVRRFFYEGYKKMIWERKNYV